MDVCFLYRYEEQITYPNTLSVRLRKFKVVKKTPCGYWIQLFDFCPNDKKWVSNNARKRYAYPTIEAAERNFIARKERQIKILKNKLHQAKMALRIIAPSEEDKHGRRSFNI